MKSYGNLWEQITSVENFALAWRRVRRRHSTSVEVRDYERNIEKNLEDLRLEVLGGVYRPSGYRQFKIWDPKPRIISCAPVRDRIVHHALCAVITPFLERRFFDGSYACRKGKGSHRACLKARELARNYRYFLKLDVRHYFDSIPHKRLLEILLPMFREKSVKSLIECIVREPLPNLPADIGLPIGNLTSQWFANLYLDALDHHITRDELVGGRYLRYMDDMLIFSESKSECWHLATEIENWLVKERMLSLKTEATLVAPVSEGVPFLGLRIFPKCWRLRRGRFLRTRHTIDVKLRLYAAGAIDEKKFVASVTAADGATRWFGFKGILGNILSSKERLRKKGRPLVRTGSTVAGAGTTMRRIVARRTATTTTRPTRTTTLASASPAHCSQCQDRQGPIPENLCFADTKTKMLFPLPLVANAKIAVGKSFCDDFCAHIACAKMVI